MATKLAMPTIGTKTELTLEEILAIHDSWFPNAAGFSKDPDGNVTISRNDTKEQDGVKKRSLHVENFRRGKGAGKYVLDGEPIDRFI